jgi:FkbM family methyltransferase
MPDWVRNDPQASLSGKKIILCGSKMVGEARFLSKHCHIIGVVDDFLWRSRSSYLGLKVYSTDEWIDAVRADSAIISIIAVSSVAGEDHFSRVMLQHGIRGLRMLDAFRVLADQMERVTGVGNIFVYGIPFFRHAIENIDDYLRTADLLEDEFSRFTYFSILNYRLEADPRLLQRCAVGHNTESQRYNSYMLDKSFFELSDREVFVDGGAFDGDSIQQFLHAVNGKFRHIYAFEPSPLVAERCRDRVRSLQLNYLYDIESNVTVTERGMWDKEANLLFNPTQYGPRETALSSAAPLAGHVIEAGMTQHIYLPDEESDGSFSIQTASIDASCEEPVSLIKLEVEGSELKALQGAEQTIDKFRPKMAISVYHKPEDFIELTRFVNQTCKEYSISLRQHNPYVPDAMVCYCR